MSVGAPSSGPSAGQARQPRLAVGAISLGCPKNLVDTEVMLGLLQGAGFAVVANPEQADVILVNTCCFIAPAREEAAETLKQALAWKQESVEQVPRPPSAGAGGPKTVICAGCWPQRSLEELSERFPEIDAFMCPDDVPHVVSVVRQAIAGRRWRRPATSSPSYLYDDTVPRLRATPAWTGYMKIAEGCSHRCSFCAIPRLRGRYRCRSLPSVVREAERLAGEGVVEMILVAQDTTAYHDPDTGADLADLLAALAGLGQGRWIRLLYGFPTRVTDRVIEVMAQEPAICHYLDLPFQHADQKVLRRMARPGDAESYLRLVARLRGAMPEIALRSTFLVGFPGEGEQAFEHLLEFVEAAQLDRVGAFCFSPEPGTPAAEMADQVPPELVRERYHQLMALQQTISLARNQRWVGRTLEVLVESAGEGPRQWLGRSFRDAPGIDGLVVIQSPARLRPGSLLTARVTQAGPYDLTAAVTR